MIRILELKQWYCFYVLYELHVVLSQVNSIEVGNNPNHFDENVNHRHNKSEIISESIKGSKVCYVNSDKISKDTNCCLVDFENFGNVTIHVSYNYNFFKSYYTFLKEKQLAVLQFQKHENNFLFFYSLHYEFSVGKILMAILKDSRKMAAVVTLKVAKPSW